MHLIGALCFLALVRPALAAPAGDASTRWSTIETEHFAIHYAESRRDPDSAEYHSAAGTAARLAGLAEEMWPRICAQYNYFLLERVHIVVSDAEEGLVASAEPASDLIRLSAHPGPDLTRHRGEGDWLASVLAHEFSHIVARKAVRRFAEGVTEARIGIVGEGGHSAVVVDVPIADAPPWVWEEGAAEYHALQAGYSSWTTARDSGLRATVMSDGLPGWEEWIGRGDSAGEAGYRESLAFALYLRERFGSDTVARIGLAVGRGGTWRGALREVTGSSGSELYAAWVATLRERYRAQVTDAEAKGIVVAGHVDHAVTAARAAPASGAHSWRESVHVSTPDGSLVAFLEARDGTRNVVVRGAHGRKQLTSFDDGTWMQGLDWSPDGTKLVVAMHFQGQQDLFILAADGGSPLALTRDGWEELDPTWGVDGNIYFRSDEGGFPDIWALDPTTHRKRRVSGVVDAGGPSAPVEVRASAASWRDVSPAPLARPYRTVVLAPTGTPLLRFSLEPSGDVHVSAGAQVRTRDALDHHALDLYGLLGADSVGSLRYEYAGWFPRFAIGGYHASEKQIVTSGSGEATLQRLASVGQVQVTLPWSEGWSTSAFGSVLGYAVGTNSAVPSDPFQVTAEGGALVAFAGTRGLRTLTAGYSRGFTAIVYGPTGRSAVDDGEALDRYSWNQGDVSWHDALALPELGRAGADRHHLRFDLDLGYIDRNVHANDEYRAGGRVEGDWRWAGFRTNVPFWGYPAYSLAGETLGIARVGWEFPLGVPVHRIAGPLRIVDVAARISGSAGNVWSFVEPVGEGGPLREVPFRDVASANGNGMLFDAAVELRVRGAMFGAPWTSFLRVAYGFNRLAWDGDTDLLGAAGGSVASGSVLPGPRIFLGIGTGG